MEWIDESGTIRSYETFALTVVCSNPKPWPAYIADWRPVEASRLLIDFDCFPAGMKAEYDGNGIVTVSIDSDKLPENADFSQASLDLFVSQPMPDCGIRGWSQAGGGSNIYGPATSGNIQSIKQQLRDNASAHEIHYSVIGMNVFRPFHQHGDDVTVYTVNGPTGDFAGSMAIVSWWKHGQNPQTDAPYLTEYVIIRVEDCSRVWTTVPYTGENLLPDVITQPVLVLPEGSTPVPAEALRFKTTFYPQKGANARYYLLELADQDDTIIEGSNGGAKVFMPYPESISEEEKKYLKITRMDGADLTNEVYSFWNGGLHLTETGFGFWTQSFGPFLLTWNEEVNLPRCANGHPMQYFLATQGSGLAEVCSEGCHEAFVTLCDASDEVAFDADLNSLILWEGEWLGEQPEIYYSPVNDGINSGWSADIPADSGSYAVLLKRGPLMTYAHHFVIAEMILPSELEKIEPEAFAGASFVCVVCPDGLTEIGSRAFADCINLSRIVIPASVSAIADDAFEGCSSLLIEGESGSFAESFAQCIGAEFQKAAE